MMKIICFFKNVKFTFLIAFLSITMAFLFCPVMCAGICGRKSCIVPDDWSPTPKRHEEPNFDPATEAYNTGCQLSKQGRYSEAEAYYRRAISINPGYASAHWNLANALIKQGRHKAGVVEMREALRLDPRNKKFKKSLAEWEEHFRKKQEADRQNARVDAYTAAHKRGIAFYKKRDYSGAEAAFREAIRIIPYGEYGASGHFNLGLSLRYQWRSLDAIESYREALRLDPGFSRAQDEINILEAERKNAAKIIPPYPREEEQEQERLAREEEERLAKEKEKQELQEAMHRVNNKIFQLEKTIGISGTSLFTKGSKDSAPVDLRIMPLNKPLVGNPEEVNGRALTPQDNQHTDELVRKEALKLKHVGDSLIQSGKYKAAEDELLKALNLSPYDEDTRQSLLLLYGKQVPKLVEEGRLEEAYFQLSKAVALSPGDVALRESVNKFGAALGYLPIPEGEQLQTQSTGEQSTAESKGETPKETLQLIKFQDMVPENRLGETGTTPTKHGDDVKSNTLDRLLNASADAIAAAAEPEHRREPASKGAGRGLDDNKPLNTRDLPVVKDVTRSRPVDTQDYIVPERFKNNAEVVKLTNEFNEKNRVIGRLEKKLEQIKNTEKHPSKKSNERTAQKDDIVKQIKEAKEQKMAVEVELQKKFSETPPPHITEKTKEVDDDGKGGTYHGMTFDEEDDSVPSEADQGENPAEGYKEENK